VLAGWLSGTFIFSVGQTKKIQLRLSANANYQCNLLTTTKTAAGCVYRRQRPRAFTCPKEIGFVFVSQIALYCARLSSTQRTSGIIAASGNRLNGFLRAVHVE
jgi:hypothetical protein